MLRATELAHRDERVHVSRFSLEVAGRAPELWRTLVAQRALEAFAAVTPLAPMPPEHVHRAHEPVLVCHVERDRALTVGEDPRTTDERRVMDVEDVVRPACDDLADAPTVGDWFPELLREDRGENSEPASQRNDIHTIVFDRGRRRRWCERFVRVD